MSVKRGRKLGQASIRILRTVFEAGASAVTDIIETHKYDEFVRLRVYKQLYNLERRGYLEIKRDKNNTSFFHLTPKGKLSFLKYLHLEKLRGKKWDKQWRVIIFDIPESLKKWREYLRYELKNLGFHPLQESVYVTPYLVTGELDSLLKEWGMRKYFRYLTVSEIDGEEGLKAVFGIGGVKNK